MDGVSDRRSELGRFLRSRREGVARADYVLPTERSRTAGLRREEVADLAGVSVTWYTWLEQGRNINPSRQVLEAVAGKLRLTPAEHDYILELAGFAAATRADALTPIDVPPHLQNLLDSQLPSPALTISQGWNVGGWNRTCELLYPNLARGFSGERNLLALIFTDPYVRDMLPDWETTSRKFIAEYRADVGALLSDPAQVALIRRLQEQSADFARSWARHEVERFTSRERYVVHPHVGELHFEHYRLMASDAPEYRVVIYVPKDGTETRQRLQLLLGGPDSLHVDGASHAAGEARVPTQSGLRRRA